MRIPSYDFRTKYRNFLEIRKLEDFCGIRENINDAFEWRKVRTEFRASETYLTFISSKKAFDSTY